ncbi:type II toxin-antitoxin system antitoxin DNA ADP-ribosyl glycohydrolase DarG [Citrobacter werkmanii]|uniref:type II toxin-antitoxin system antitoxin DNA ADP-ribosyl glycohydrolase DarG n=1 Tax=Citrobacter werkmanii TaxID=67827 RepID=UPI0037C8D144
MIEYRHGDILHADTEAIINTVNCVGVMGRGIALQFKNAYPDNFKAYAKACKAEQVKPGKMFVFETNQLTGPRYIVNFPTKRHWKGKSRIEDIVSGLEDLVRVVENYNIRSIAIPPLGSGLGGLEWQDVKPLIESAVKPLKQVQIAIYDPKGAPSSERMANKTEVPKMTAGRAALIELMQRYLNGLLDPFISLLELHKLMYFMQEAGEPLRLKYQKAHYGPYAENLRHVLNAIEGHMISGYSDGGDLPEKQLILVPGAIDEARQFLARHEETQHRFQRVSELVEGFESSFGLELLATVHWTMTHESITSSEEVMSFIYNWNERKQQFSPRQITLAMDVLKKKQWV